MISVCLQVDAPASTLWATLIDVETLPQLTDSITAVSLENGRPLGPGCRVRISQPRIPSTVWVVTEWKPGREFTWVATGLGVRSRATHRVVAAGGGTRIELGLEHTGPLGWLSRLLFDRRGKRY
ncbi:SRPBCC family protein, partial [Nocardioides sp.]|uniref:SRPBCC family protein n=1 Tax=Nocardioides sp. TaxID=35761 RepID=UPI002735FC22